VRTIAVVPAYNEEITVGEVVRDVALHVDEVVVVDDGSADETASLARSAGATVIEHSVNTGVGGAVRTGYRYAIRNGYDVLVQVDADGQHDPAYLPELLEAISESDVVIGSRYLNDSHREYSFLRRLGIRSFTTLVNALGGTSVTDVTSGYRVYRVDVLEQILHRADAHWAVEQTLMAAKAEYRIEEISVEMPVRESGHSQFSTETLLMYPVRMIDTVFRILVFR
jgi:glycosyltransferase involved in cell wall biosynthesis